MLSQNYQTDLQMYMWLFICVTDNWYVRRNIPPKRPSACEHGVLRDNVACARPCDSKVQNNKTSHDEPWTDRCPTGRRAMPTAASRHNLDCLRDNANRSVTAMEATHLSRFYMPQQMRAVSGSRPTSALRRVQLTSYDRDGGRSKLRIRSESCPDLPGTGHGVTFAWYSRARHQVGEGVGEVETHCG